MELQRNVSIKEYTTFKMGGIVDFFIMIKNNQDIEDFILFSKEKNIPFLILGGGSNIIFPDANIHKVVGLMQIDFITKIFEDEESVVFKVGAGTLWDEFVAYTVSLGLSGIEAMSFIPGTVGATPVQNVGAYGQDISQTLVSVEVYDTIELIFKTFTNTECHFAYRQSIFKEDINRYIITSITIKLSRGVAPVPNYPGVQEYFLKNKIENPTLFDIREAIISIRKTKLPDPREIYSVGSFFKNPIISKTDMEKLKEKYPTMVCFDIGDDLYKIGAGWMIDTLGLKGKSFGNISLYKHNALVVVNNGQSTREELENFIEFIQEKTLVEFDITLEPEPIFI